MNNYQQPYQQDPMQQDPYQQPFQPQKPQSSDSKPLIALIMGIVAMACPVLSLPSCLDAYGGLWFFAIFPVFGLAAGIVGLIMSILAKNKAGMGITGMILSIVGLAFNFVLFFSCTICYGCFGCIACSTGVSIERLYNQMF